MCVRSQDGSFLSVAEKSVDSQIFSLSWIPSSARFCTLGTDIKGRPINHMLLTRERESTWMCHV